MPFPATDRVNEGGCKARPCVQHSSIAAGPSLAQPVWQHTGDEAEEACCLSEDNPEDYEEGFQGFDD